MRKVPELRFTGFDGEWEENYLSEIAKINPKGTPVPEKFKYVDLTSVSGTSLVNFDIINKEEAPSRAQRVAKKGDIFYQTVRPYQKNNFFFDLEDTDFIFSTGYAQIRTTNNSRYLFTFMQTKRFVDTVMNRTTGTSFPAISTSELSDINIKIPSNISEQEKIGDLFRKLDDLIEIQEGKISKMEDYKKSMLQKMFPKKGKLVPEFRFDGFDGEWVKVKISDLYSEAGSGGTPSSKVSDYYDGDISFLSISDITKSTGHINKTEKSITELGLNNSSAWIVPSGSITLAMYASVGKVAINDIDLATSQAFFNMIINDNNSTQFVYQIFKKMEIFNEWRNQITTGTQPNLNAKIINDTLLIVPKLEEQAKIGQFFKNLDTQIENEERLLDSYKMMKKSLLQKMFV